MRLCSLSVRTRLRLHPMQVSRPPRTGAGLLPGGVRAGVPDPTAGKLKEYRGGGDAKGIGVAGIEGAWSRFSRLWALRCKHSESRQALQRRSRQALKRRSAVSFYSSFLASAGLRDGIVSEAIWLHCGPCLQELPLDTPRSRDGVGRHTSDRRDTPPAADLKPRTRSAS